MKHFMLIISLCVPVQLRASSTSASQEENSASAACSDQRLQQRVNILKAQYEKLDELEREAQCLCSQVACKMQSSRVSKNGQTITERRKEKKEIKRLQRDAQEKRNQACQILLKLSKKPDIPQNGVSKERKEELLQDLYIWHQLGRDTHRGKDRQFCLVVAAQPLIEQFNELEYSLSEECKCERHHEIRIDRQQRSDRDRLWHLHANGY